MKNKIKFKKKLYGLENWDICAIFKKVKGSLIILSQQLIVFYF